MKQISDQAPDQVAAQRWLDAATAVTPWADMQAVYLPEVDSTSRFALTYGAEHGGSRNGAPVLVWAGRQVAGVGRQGRRWIHEPGRSLAFSIGVPYAPATWEGLSLVVGLSLAQALHPQVQLKWPNDLWWQQRKLGGVLIQTGALPASVRYGTAARHAGSRSGRGVRYTVIGIGLNLYPLTVPADHTGSTQAVAACSSFLPADEILPERMLRRVVPSVLAHLVRFQAQGFQPFRSAYNATDGLRGMQVQTSDGLHATAQGADDSGGLLLQTADGAWQTYSGLEVSVRPAVSAVQTAAAPGSR